MLLKMHLFVPSLVLMTTFLIIAEGKTVPKETEDKKDTKATEEPKKAPDCKAACYRDWSPVCGSDKKTYGNRCTFDFAACMSRLGPKDNITLDHVGECKKTEVKEEMKEGTEKESKVEGHKDAKKAEEKPKDSKSANQSEKKDKKDAKSGEKKEKHNGEKSDKKSSDLSEKKSGEDKDKSSEEDKDKKKKEEAKEKE